MAVLDTGVAAANGLFADLRTFAPDGSVTDPIDDDGHGSACASLIASRDDFAPGIAPDASITSIQVTAAGEPIEGLVRQAILTAVKQGCHVISCSFTLRKADAATLDIVRDACNRGVVVIAASGNEPDVASAFPERTPNVLVVGPYGHDREPLQGRFGAFTDILSPGVDLPVVSRDGSRISFGQSSGAAAVTAGVVALVLSITRAQGTARVGLALEGLAKATALTDQGVRFLDADRLLIAAERIP